FIEKKGEFRGPFGVMGGFMQPQGHLQVLLSQIEDKLNPQAALDRPRWQWIGGNRLLVEPEFDAGLLADLRRRGHEIEISEDEASFGRGQIIYRYEDGRLEGACEPRTDSLVAAY
ncbi:MAG TPA: gamma-glutamyltransferase, partial [Clostridiaceae bacterium]|nr:gamma-glutamyltransferase [Clostridiaceae bacterium]